MKAVITAMWQLFRGLLFYPMMVGLFLWVYFTGKHFIFGLAIIAIILWVDPIWKIMWHKAIEIFKKR